MAEAGFWTRFILAALATWRITHLLVYEDGPADVVVELRARLGHGFIGALMDCFYCLSFWVAAPTAIFVCRKPLDLLLTWLALSGAACLLERSGHESREGDMHHGMLWSETRSTQEPRIDGPGNHPNLVPPDSSTRSTLLSSSKHSLSGTLTGAGAGAGDRARV